MWVITRVQMRIDGAFERALAEVVEREAAACPCCTSVLQATGALPAHCTTCGRVRSIQWQARVEELASRELAGERVKA
jgi:tRNA(Ile2) C34 agmatinyltransferase TiaS